MKSWQVAMKDAAISGGFAAMAVNATTAVLGRAETGHALAPINAVSHVLWGDRAAEMDQASMKYTFNGLAINSGAAVFWATIYEKFFGEAADRRDLPLALLGGGLVGGMAYVVDYHLVPERLTPGYDKRLSGKSMAVLYGALALGLTIGALLRKQRAG
ncbi:hypothetical protein [Thermithiobacillus plumbiphilus]|uniref:Uncharacterized protein n=1 Tax=Thermithiobacillus plumbiphilus TaxID=1729899 RepID=A0ABU9DEI1_9PROT